MRIIFRADASVQIGSGHLMRCLTLADQLRNEGAEVGFICREQPGGMFDLLRARDYRFAKLQASESGLITQKVDALETIEAAKQLFTGHVDWLVVDHYQLDAIWESLLRTNTSKLMVIDDLADRPHDCDLLLDQNFYIDMDRRYEGLIPKECVAILGPKFVLLRPEFAAARRKLKQRNSVVRRILIFFGGSDPNNLTSKAIDAIKLINNSNILVDVVVGAANPHKNVIESKCYGMPGAHFHCQVSNMAELIAAADVAIGAGGATTWERCALGLPALTVVFADNQLQTTLDLEKIGATEFLGWADKITVSYMSMAINCLIHDPNRLKSLSANSSHVMREWMGAGSITTIMQKTIK